MFVICSGSVSVAAMEHLADDLSALFAVGAGFLDTLTIVRSFYVADDSGLFLTRRSADMHGNTRNLPQKVLLAPSAPLRR